MRDLRLNAGLFEYLLDLCFLFARLDADGETKDLAEEVDEQLKKGEEMFFQRYQKAKLTTFKQAQVAYQDGHGDRTILDCGRTSVAVHGGEQSTGHKNLFEIVPSKMIKLAYARQVIATLRLLGKLEALAAGSVLGSFVGRLKSYLENFQAAQEALKQAKLDQAATSHEIDLWRQDVKKLRRGIFGQLTDRFRDDKKRVESYYREGTDQSDREYEPETPPPSAA